MRKIEYIVIDSYCQRKPDSHALPNLGYHFVVNAEGLVIKSTDKYNKSTISIHYCGSLSGDANVPAIQRQRTALIHLLVELRKHYPNAKILGVSEFDDKALYAKNITVSDAMNVLRKELSEL